MLHWFILALPKFNIAAEKKSPSQQESSFGTIIFQMGELLNLGGCKVKVSKAGQNPQSLFPWLSLQGGPKD